MNYCRQYIIMSTIDKATSTHNIEFFITEDLNHENHFH
nr:MAG TPA: hypothetical protein [Caudoviricetes sp.]